jgi:TonB family protein
MRNCLVISATAALAWSSATLAAPASAAPTPATTPAHPSPPAPAAPDPSMAFYPAAARAAGVEGQVIIHCGRNAHLKLQGCTLVSEIPVGQGFGAAALAMAAANAPNPKVNTDDPYVTKPSDIQIHFSLHPPTVDPDLSQVAHMVSPAKLLSQPTRDQITAAYPARALADKVEGAAELICMVGADGLLSDCKVERERPSDYGFGAAALDLVKDYKVQPRALDGQPIRSEVAFGVPFTLIDPDAPLTLQAPDQPTPPPQR